jgi:hypothetical protein
MTHTVQLCIADAVYATALRNLLVHSGPWNVKAVDRPDPVLPGVLVVDEPAFRRLSLPLVNPERVVVIIRHDPKLMAQAWDAGIVSVVSGEDSPTTVLLAIMAAALRIANPIGATRKSANQRKHTRREIEAES